MKAESIVGALVCLLVLALTGWQSKSCSEEGGKLVRGVVWWQCVDAKKPPGH